MIDTVKSGTEVDLNHSGLPPHHQRILYGVCHTKKGITSAKTFLISELSGWKHTFASIKRPRRTDTRRPKTFESIGVKEIDL